MQAFMSRRDGRNLSGFAARVRALGPIGGGVDYAYCVRAEGRDADSAVREVRRILAETEPEWTRLAHGVYRPRHGSMSVHETINVPTDRPAAFSALAEALAAFVAE